MWLSAQIIAIWWTIFIEREIGSYLPQYLGDALPYLLALGWQNISCNTARVFLCIKDNMKICRTSSIIYGSSPMSQRGTRDSEIYSACYSDCSWHRIFIRARSAFRSDRSIGGSHRLYLWDERCNRAQPDGSGLCVDSLSGAGKPAAGKVSAGNSGL